jgi:hypothetical protein
MAFASGARYDGDWRDGEMTGRGVLTLPNGERWEGHFVNGEWQQ